MSASIPVIDVFAGPGGLGEGFACYKSEAAGAPFDIKLSIEKDANAHQTLTLRALYRQLAAGQQSKFWNELQCAPTPFAIYEKFPVQAESAHHECVRIELAPQTADVVRDLIKQRLPRGTEKWVLLGGPPCQAYSLVGRSRNRGNPNYEPLLDHRQTLYLEYLQILADHRPAVFVVENVKGLLSATLANNGLFDRIRDDLSDPGLALRRENRRGRFRPRYKMFAIGSSTLSRDDLPDFVVKAEQYGIPQARHRVILVGVLDGLQCGDLGTLVPSDTETSVAECIGNLPRLRSGVTDEIDGPEKWRDIITRIPSRRWAANVDADVRDRMKALAGDIHVPRTDRGAEFQQIRRSGALDGIILNHSARAHITADLERYFFASAFAQVRRRSPTLSDFPRTLLPLHANVNKALNGGLFSDRFRVQVSHRPSTTITSHISKDGHYYIHYDPTQCRSLTVREAARLQTFPDDYFFCGPRTSQYHQVGNAVPPKLAREIAKIVYDLLR